MDLDYDPGAQVPRPALFGLCGLCWFLLLRNRVAGCKSPMARSGPQDGGC